MRRMLIAIAVALFLSGPLFAQDWIEYASQRDFFTINFPGQPAVQEIKYTSEHGIDLPARVYSAASGQSRYSVTAVDFNPAAQLHQEKSKTCVASGAYPDVCGDRSQNDLRGAMDHAIFGFLKRNAKVTLYGYYNADLVEGKSLQLENPDGSRTFAVVNMHQNRLYIVEGTVPRGFPPPALFQQSLGFIDNEGKRIRYATVYHNLYPAPPRSR